MKRIEKGENSIRAVIYATMISMTFSTIAPQVCKDRYNIYENRKLIISESEVNNIIRNLQKDIKKNIPSILVDEYLLLDAINKNDNLTKEEKQRFYNMINIIKDNPYINSEKAYTNLLNLDIEYVKNREEVDGTWDCPNFKIKIDNNLHNTREKNVENHEIIHSFFEYFSDIGEDDRPQFIIEGMCSLFNLEYCNKTEWSIGGDYLEYVTFVKMLCETVGSDVVLQAYSTSNMSHIYTAMASIKGSYEEAEKIIKDIDLILQKSLKSEIDIKNYNDLANVDKCIKKLDDYYDVKTNRKEKIQKAREKGQITGDFSELDFLSIEFDEKHDFYYYNREFLEKLLHRQYSKSLFAKGVYAHKAYFSEELKHSYDKPYIEEVKRIDCDIEEVSRKRK